jgi:hypothetical protein
MQNSGRAQRVEHKVQRKLNLTAQQQAVLCVLMLRRPQTLNEIKLRTDRMAEFTSPDQIRTILEEWLSAERPLVMKLAAQAGQREERYYHTLGTETLADLQAELGNTKNTEPSSPIDELRYESLLKRIEELERRVENLESSSAEG